MKLLFLDIDGVINCEKYVREHIDERGVLIDNSKMLIKYSESINHTLYVTKYSYIKRLPI